MNLFFKKTIGYAILCWVLNLGVGYYLGSFETIDLQEKNQFFPALRWADYYNRQSPVEVLVLGSSHAYRAYDPEVMGVEMQQAGRVFNFGSSAQSPVTSYFVLKELAEKHKPKLVILDLYFMVFTADDQLKNGRFNWQQMKDSPTKRQFFKEGFSLADQVSLLFFPTSTYKVHLKSKINKLLGRRYLPPSKGMYQGEGFVSTPDTLAFEKLKCNNQFDVFKIDTDAITKRNMIYLKKIKNYCSAENIPLVFVTAPMPSVSVEKIPTYENFHQLFLESSKDWNVLYFDYNINRISVLNDSTHYYDDDHLNAAGAVVFSKVLAEDLTDTD